MTVISADRDTEALSLTFVAEYDAPPERVWQVWADARQLEKWWGPPGYPATFTRHDFTVGGTTQYFMTGPEGERYPGWWEIAALEEPHRIAFVDGFADQEGNRVEEPPANDCEVTLERVDGRTRMTVVTRFTSAEHLQTVLDMGMEEGLRQALDQIDGVLAPTPA